MKSFQKTNIDLTLFPNAHHGFDSEEPVHRNEKGYSFEECLFDLTEDGDILMNYLKFHVKFYTTENWIFVLCQRGVDIGGNLEAAKVPTHFALEFMKKQCKRINLVN